jgi:hypothetical protein
MIAGLDDTDSGVGYDFIVIDWNGLSGSNTEGDDEIVVKAVISSAGRTGSVREDAGYPVSKALWAQIFSN